MAGYVTRPFTVLWKMLQQKKQETQMPNSQLFSSLEGFHCPTFKRQNWGACMFWTSSSRRLMNFALAQGQYLRAILLNFRCGLWYHKVSRMIYLICMYYLVDMGCLSWKLIWFSVTKSKIVCIKVHKLCLQLAKLGKGSGCNVQDELSRQSGSCHHICYELTSRITLLV